MNFYMYSMWSRYTALVIRDEDIQDDANGNSTQEFEVTVRLKDPLPLDRYKKLKMHPYRESRKTLDGSDFPSTNLMIMSERAVDALKELISKDGIFYPLDIIGVSDKYFLFHVTRTINCIDEEMSEGSLNRYDSMDAKFTYIRKFYLKKEMIEPRVHVFKDGRYGNWYKFVSDDFYSIVKKNKLKGLLLYPEGVDQMNGKPLIVNKSLAKEPVQTSWQ